MLCWIVIYNRKTVNFTVHGFVGGDGETHINILLGYWYRMVANPSYLWDFSIYS